MYKLLNSWINVLVWLFSIPSAHLYGAYFKAFTIINFEPRVRKFLLGIFNGKISRYRPRKKYQQTEKVDSEEYFLVVLYNYKVK